MRTRRLPRTSASVAIAVAATGVAGVGIGAAAVKKPPSYKACATKASALVLLKNGKCPKGTHGVTLGAQGPAGAPGAAGASGAAGVTGPKGDTGGQGVPGTANTVALHFTQATADNLGIFHNVGTLDGFTFKATCYTAAAVNLLDVEAISTTKVTIYAHGVGIANSGPATAFLGTQIMPATTTSVELFIVSTGAGNVGTVDSDFTITGAGHATMTGTLSMQRLTGGTNDCIVDGTLTDGPIPSP